MYIDVKKSLTGLGLILVGLVLGILISIGYQRFKSPKQTVTVVGSSELDAPTDQATISAEIRNTGKTQEESQNENKKDVASLKSALVALGIPESRITQSGYSTTPIYKMTNDVQGMMPYRPPTTDNTTYTSMTIVLDSLKKIDQVYKAINNNPNTQIQNTYYSLGNRNNWQAKAKEAALVDARSQIEQIAKTNKLKVGKLVNLRDLSQGGIYPLPMYDNVERSTAPEGSNTMEAPAVTGVTKDNVFYSEQTVKITASYQASYELY